MATLKRSFDRLSDADLLSEITHLARCERHATATLIASLSELDARRLYLAEGYSSLFTYCTSVLHLSRQVEELASRVAPRPAIPATTRKLPEPKPPIAPSAVARAETPLAPSPTLVAAPSPKPAEVTPLSPERYKVQFTVSKETHDKLRRVQDLLRHTVPNGDPAIIFDKAVSLLLTALERTKVAATGRPRSPRATAAGSRRIPARVKRTVWTRDGGRCAFVGTSGRCGETGLLEFHHVVPFADGGETSAGNIELRCRPHSAYEAETWFGPQFPAPSGEHGIDVGPPCSTRSGPS